MEVVYLPRVNEVKLKKNELEKKLNVSLKIVGKRVYIEGESFDEYDALNVFEAIAFGFSVVKALLLKDDDVIFRKVHIKSHTKRNLKDVRARLIGTKGKARRTMSEISGCEIIVGESEVGIIGDAEDVEQVERAVIHLIEGAKQSNMYKFLERMNRVKKEHTDFE